MLERFKYIFSKNQTLANPKPIEPDIPSVSSDVSVVYDFIKSHKNDTEKLNAAKQNGIQRGHIGVAYAASEALNSPLTEEELFRTFRNHLYTNTSFFEKTKKAVESGAAPDEEARLAKVEFEGHFTQIEHLRTLARTERGLGNSGSAAELEQEADEIEKRLKNIYLGIEDAVGTAFNYGERLTRNPRQVFNRFDINGQSLGEDFLEDDQELKYIGSTLGVIFSDLFRTRAEDEIYDLGKNAATIVLNRKLASLYKSFEEFEFANSLFLDSESRNGELSQRDQVKIIFDAAKTGPVRADFTELVSISVPSYSLLHSSMTPTQKTISRYIQLFKPKIAQNVRRELGLQDFDLFGAYDARDRCREDIRACLISDEIDVGGFVPEKREAFSLGTHLDKIITNAEQTLQRRLKMFELQLHQEIKEIEDVTESAKIHQFLKAIESPTVEEARKKMEAFRRGTYRWFFDNGQFDLLNDKQAHEFIIGKYEEEANNFYDQDFSLQKAFAEGDLNFDTFMNVTETAQRLEKIRQVSSVRRAEKNVGPLVKQEILDTVYLEAAKYGYRYLKAFIENESPEILKSEEGQNTITTISEALKWYADRINNPNFISTLRDRIVEAKSVVELKVKAVPVS